MTSDTAWMAEKIHKLEAALTAIAENAEAWHGTVGAKARALDVIAKMARDALEVSKP